MNLYFSVQANVVRPENIAGGLIAVKQPITMDVKLSGVPKNSISGSGFQPQLLYSGTLDTELDCGKHLQQCTLINVMTESQYQYSLVREYDVFNLT
jgi:hypothetical protein